MADIPQLTDVEWEALTVQLTYYASCKLARRYWRGVKAKRGQAVTGGHEASDLAVSVIDGSRESWNKERYPDFFRFLQSIIDSKISAMVRSMENRKSRQMQEREEGSPDPAPYTVKSSGPTPDEVVEDAEWKEKFRGALAREVGEDSITLGLFDCLEAEITDRREIAQVLEVEVNDIYNAQKRLQRKVDAVLRKLDQQGKKP